MTFYVLLVTVGLNVTGFGIYDSRTECATAAQEAVANSVFDIDAICIDMKDHLVTDIAGRGPTK